MGENTDRVLTIEGMIIDNTKLENKLQVENDGMYETYMMNFEPTMLPDLKKIRF